MAESASSCDSTRSAPWRGRPPNPSLGVCCRAYGDLCGRRRPALQSRVRTSSTAADSDAAEIRRGARAPWSTTRTADPGSSPGSQKNHGLEPASSHNGGLVTARVVATRTRYAVASTGTATISDLLWVVTSILLCNRDAANPATAPTTTPALGPRALKNGSTRDTPVIIQSMMPPTPYLPDRRAMRSQHIRDDVTEAAVTMAPLLEIPSRCISPAESVPVHCSHTVRTRKAATSAKRAVLN